MSIQSFRLYNKNCVVVEIFDGRYECNVARDEIYNLKNDNYRRRTANGIQ